jgi:hypothetical protein
MNAYSHRPVFYFLQMWRLMRRVCGVEIRDVTGVFQNTKYYLQFLNRVYYIAEESSKSSPKIVALESLWNRTSRNLYGYQYDIIM